MLSARELTTFGCLPPGGSEADDGDSQVGLGTNDVLEARISDGQRAPGGGACTTAMCQRGRDYRSLPNPCGWLRSDDRGVAKLCHHARHHVVEIVAVKRPAAGIVGVKGDGDAAHWRHQDGIAHGTCERCAV